MVFTGILSDASKNKNEFFVRDKESEREHGRYRSGFDHILLDY